LEIDITDAVLVQAARIQRASTLATDDRKLIQACYQAGLTPETAIDDSLQQQFAGFA